MTVKESAEKAKDAVRSTYETTRARAGETYDRAAAKTGEFYASARDRTSAAGHRAADAVEHNPITALIGGLGIGMLLGAILPRTRKEDELIGPYGSQITGRAREAANAAKEVGREKLDEYGFKQTAKDTAQKVMNDAKMVASEAASAAAKKAKGGSDTAE